MEKKLDIDLIRSEIEACNNIKELEILENKYLSRENGLISIAMKDLAKISNPDEKKALGANFNLIKKTVSGLIEEKQKLIKEKEIDERIRAEKIDVTAPANNVRYMEVGLLHPITQTIDRLKKILHQEGFAVFDGYEIETSFYNFSALNTHKLHPARQTQDTIYVDSSTINDEIKNNGYYGSPEDDKDFLLRTHTSAQHIRIAKNIIEKIKNKNQNEDNYQFKYATLGPTYRNESDGTHSPMFHQMECVCIAKKVYVQDLINDLSIILSKFFEIKLEELEIKLRSSYFPFTVPSWEVDLFLPSKNSFVEILGCGMMHDSIIKQIGLDPSVYVGYALGAGIERLCMLKNDIGDLRRLFQPDLQYLKSI